MKKALQDNQQSRITSLNATEIDIHENIHGSKLISAVEEWYLRKVCYSCVFVAFFMYVKVLACIHVCILYRQLSLNFKVFRPNVVVKWLTLLFHIQ
jgi:hypothetical protein